MREIASKEHPRWAASAFTDFWCAQTRQGRVAARSPSHSGIRSLVNRTALPLAFGALALALALIATVGAGLGAAFTVGTTAAYVAGGGIIARHGESLPIAGFGAANSATLARLTITCLFAGYAAALLMGLVPTAGQSSLMFGLGVAALALDALDGWLARKTGTDSVFGARFDMEVDAALILVLSIVAWKTGKAGAWVLMSGAARYLYVGAACILPSLRAPVPASQRRRAIAAIQGTVLVVLMAPAIASPLSDVLAAVALALLLYSFGTDMLWQLGLGRRAGDAVSG
jgi:phosphatidylglycerophosphate synthase